ncbi:MAG: tetratricopeptide repeat protein [Rhodanobacteraceae bacterium]
MQTAPWVPASDDVVLQEVPPSTDPRVRKFDQLRAQLRSNPNDMHAALTLARAYIDYGRSTGDARFIGRALAVIEPWLKQSPIPVPVALLHATIRQNRHRFKDARAQLQHIVQREPGNAQAWLTLATVAMVQGDLGTANHACIKLASTGGNFMGTACTASLRALSGHNAQAMALLRLIQDPGPKAPADIKSWIQGLMADVAVRMGDAGLAERHFQQALQWTPDDNFLLADYADFLLDQGRPAEAASLVRPYAQSDTSFLRMVMAEKAQGLPAAESDAHTMQERFAAMDERGSHVYRREQAGFVLQVLGQPDQALRLARQNWQVQRAPKDVLVYLQAALAADKPEDAQPALRFVARTGLDDARLTPLITALGQKMDMTGQTRSSTQGDAP